MGVVIDEVWRANRPYLIDLAYRMVGDVGVAEDIVQEAFSRLTRMEDVEDERGWLIVVTSRLCLDHVRSARVRREQSADWLEEAPSLADPADRVTLDDSVRLALFVVLERLSPAERVAFVLHDLFGMPFETVSETLGKTPTACRQLARRARKKIEGGEPRYPVDAALHREITDRFIAAASNGDLEGLLAVLDPDVSGTADIPGGQVAFGAQAVASNIMRYWGGRNMVSLPLGSERAVVLGFLGHRLAAVIELHIGNRGIHDIHVTINPNQLNYLRRTASTIRTPEAGPGGTPRAPEPRSRKAPKTCP
jgi:RNA polymerase sigma-70 factor (ECF subfamily)